MEILQLAVFKKYGKFGYFSDEEKGVYILPFPDPYYLSTAIRLSDYDGMMATAKISHSFSRETVWKGTLTS